MNPPYDKKMPCFMCDDQSITGFVDGEKVQIFTPLDKNEQKLFPFFCCKECGDAFVDMWQGRNDVLSLNPEHPDNKKFFEERAK